MDITCSPQGSRFYTTVSLELASSPDVVFTSFNDAPRPDQFNLLGRLEAERTVASAKETAFLFSLIHLLLILKV